MFINKKLIHKLWYIYTIGYYSLIKRSKLLMHAMTWILLKSILSGRSQALHDSVYMNIKNKKT